MSALRMSEALLCSSYFYLSLRNQKCAQILVSRLTQMLSRADGASERHENVSLVKVIEVDDE